MPLCLLHLPRAVSACVAPLPHQRIFACALVVRFVVRLCPCCWQSRVIDRARLIFYIVVKICVSKQNTYFIYIWIRSSETQPTTSDQPQDTSHARRITVNYRTCKSCCWTTGVFVPRAGIWLVIFNTLPRFILVLRLCPHPKHQQTNHHHELAQYPLYPTVFHIPPKRLLHFRLYCPTSGKQQTANSKQQTANSKQQTANGIAYLFLGL